MHAYIKIITFAIILSCIPTMGSAQIGYQVSLLNTATGEPRANVTVNARVEITDSKDNILFSGTQQATSNDFGVLQLTVGDADTFSKADTGNMPFFISVTVDGMLIGKSQILSVPVAEVANKLKSSFTIDDLLGTWGNVNDNYNAKNSRMYVFYKNGTVDYIEKEYDGTYTDSYNYEIDGNNIYIYDNHGLQSRIRFIKGAIYSESYEFSKQ
jgi:hypothetical protein